MVIKKLKISGNVIEIFLGEWKKIKIEDYTNIEEIGSGANGVVLKANHLTTDRLVAIKVWLPHKKSKTGQVSKEQYLKEVRKIANLKHGNIVTIYDAKIYSNGIYTCVMEYVEGMPLNKWLLESPSINEKIDVCRKILETVIFYQEKGILHGDLHGGNILIDREYEIHIIDFGTSHFGRPTQSKEREAFLLVDMVNKMIPEKYIESDFVFKNYDIKKPIVNKDDSRLLYPSQIAKTLLSILIWLTL